jgi:hypothetical protein
VLGDDSGPAHEIGLSLELTLIVGVLVMPIIEV